jgi:hypothetical protein
MEEDILKQLYNGQIAPWEKDLDTAEMKTLRQQVLQDIELLESVLDDTKRADLEKIIDDFVNLQQLRMFEAFKEGFRTGGQMMIAITTEK